MTKCVKGTPKKGLSLVLSRKRNESGLSSSSSSPRIDANLILSISVIVPINPFQKSPVQCHHFISSSNPSYSHNNHLPFYKSLRLLPINSFVHQSRKKMHFSTPFSLSLAALATTASAASCTIDGSAAAYHWEVRASGVYGIPGWCGGLWDNLNRWGGLCNPSYPYCNGQDGEMVWRFTTSVGCMRGHVESVW